MDAKKVSGMLVAAVVAVLIIATANPETLTLIEFGLIGLLYGVRRRRTVLRVAR